MTPRERAEIAGKVLCLSPAGVDALESHIRRAEADVREECARMAVEVAASEIRDIARRIGPARLPESIREELEALARKYELWRTPVSRPREVCGGDDVSLGPNG